jgi:formate hydrogenlyase subunit 3/multisubunit Na+/H+ antiporter MnhD subunit
MPPALPVSMSTPGGSLLVLAIVLPGVGALLALVAGGRAVERIALATMPPGLALAVAIAMALAQSGRPVVYLLGAWTPPLGLALRADGLAAVMVVIAAGVICAVGVFARGEFPRLPGVEEARAPFAFWILLLAVWAALNVVFLAGDLFTLYVALELLTFAAVPLVCLDGRAETLAAALRYALFALIGSVLYLVGAVLIYGAHGTLDIELLARRVDAGPVTIVAASLMTVGLLAKTALFPLHLWLPPAHADAPAPASAVLSALVVKGSFFIAVRLWFDAMPGIPGPAAGQLLAALGAAAIAVGSVVALRQERLKLLIAYSTLAQIGYLFLMFPLAFDPGSARLESGGALAGGLLQAITHATAKAAMFMAAGLLYASMGHDRIGDLAGSGRARPLSVLAFALGGASLMGLPPSGAYLAKEFLLQAASATGQWWWAVVMQAGGLFTASYLVLVLAHALAPAAPRARAPAPVSRAREVPALVLALGSLALGLVDWGAYLSVPPMSPSSPRALDALWKGLWPILGGVVLAILLGRWGQRLGVSWETGAVVGPARRAGVAVGDALVRVDRALRRWPVAGVSLLALAILLGAAMLAGH